MTSAQLGAVIAGVHARVARAFLDPLARAPALFAPQLVISEWGIGGGVQNGDAVAPDLGRVAGGWLDSAGRRALGRCKAGRVGLCVAFVTAPCTLRSSVIASPPSLALYRAFLFFAPSPPLCPPAPRLPVLRTVVSLLAVQEPLEERGLQQLPVRARGWLSRWSGGRVPSGVVACGPVSLHAAPLPAI